MARIDWKHVRTLGTWYSPKLDWADPTHVPLMVEEIALDCGVLAPDLCVCPVDEALPPDPDCPHVVLAGVALDAMPGGEDAIRNAVADRLYEIAGAGGWADWLIDRATGKFPWG